MMSLAQEVGDAFAEESYNLHEKGTHFHPHPIYGAETCAGNPFLEAVTTEPREPKHCSKCDDPPWNGADKAVAGFPILDEASNDCSHDEAAQERHDHDWYIGLRDVVHHRTEYGGDEYQDGQGPHEKSHDPLDNVHDA